MRATKLKLWISPGSYSLGGLLEFAALFSPATQADETSFLVAGLVGLRMRLRRMELLPPKDAQGFRLSVAYFEAVALHRVLSILPVDYWEVLAQLDQWLVSERGKLRTLRAEFAEKMSGDFELYDEMEAWVAGRYGSGGGTLKTVREDKP